MTFHFDPQIDKKILEFRQENHLTQKQFAQGAGLSSVTISSIERGRGHPTERTCRKILNTLQNYVPGEQNTDGKISFPLSLDQFASNNGLSYMDAKKLLNLRLKSPSGRTEEEWNHLYYASQRYPELYHPESNENLP